MRALVLALLAANLGVAAYFLVYPLGDGPGRSEVAALHPERFDLASRVPLVAPPAPAGEAAPLVGHPAASAEPTPATESDGFPPCMAWRNLDKNAFAAAREQLKALAGEHTLSFTEVPMQTRSWVVYPPLDNARETREKIAELATLGIQDVLPVKEGEWKNGVSLGLYATEASARRRLAEVEKKGVKGARIERVPRLNTRFYFVIRSEDRAVFSRVEGLAAGRPGSVTARIACPS